MYVQTLIDRMPDIGKKFEYLLNTGNLLSRSGLDLQQASGFTVVAERLNFFRYLSHFRSVHRGAYFAEIRTTTVRKLLPESFGFMCPVHTPDGAPCGLLNHFTADCKVVRFTDDHETMRRSTAEVLEALGVVPHDQMPFAPSLREYIPVVLDGRPLGHLLAARAPAVVAELRRLKALALRWQQAAQVTPDMEEPRVPWHLEAAYIPYAQGGPYPGIYLFSEGARMVRPVHQLPSRDLEYIGTLEQQFMDIRLPDGGIGGSAGLRFTHE